MINLSNKLLTSIVETQLAEAGRMSSFARAIMLEDLFGCLVYVWAQTGLKSSDKLGMHCIVHDNLCVWHAASFLMLGQVKVSSVCAGHGLWWIQCLWGSDWSIR
jgi:hypothetical protein